jgi:hypothetical protein
MQVPDMQPAQAAALFAAGLTHPDMLLCAAESEVAAALAAGLPAGLRNKRKGAADTRWALGCEGWRWTCCRSTQLLHA